MIKLNLTSDWHKSTASLFIWNENAHRVYYADRFIIAIQLRQPSVNALAAIYGISGELLMSRHEVVKPQSS